MNTILLNPLTRDLTKDVDGNIALRLESVFGGSGLSLRRARYNLGELWFDTTKGIAYFQSYLGRASGTHSPPIKGFSGQGCSFTVPDVASAVLLYSIVREQTSAEFRFQSQAGRRHCCRCSHQGDSWRRSRPVLRRLWAGLFKYPDNSQYIPGMAGF